MNRTSAELKRLAREKLTGHWGLMIGATLLLSLIMFAVLIPFYALFFISRGGMVQFFAYMAATLIVSIVSVIMQCGISRMQLGFARGQNTGIGMLFGEFAQRPERYILGILMIIGMELVCFLPAIICWTVAAMQGMLPAFIIAFVLYIAGMIVGLILAFRYALVFLLMVDHLQMGSVTAFRESSRLMDGNKGRLLYIYLSYIGWSILAMLSCGIGTLWISPYMNQTIISFYLDLTGEFDRMQKAEPEFTVPQGQY
jgi:uncharacterized membrane protein